MRLKKNKKNIFILLTITLVFVGFCVYQNNFIQISKHVYKNKKIPKEFDGYRILQISDLHNKEFGENQNTLIKRIKQQKPDIIVITGDLIDAKRTNIQTSITLIKELTKTTPVYFVTGNHEIWSGCYDTLKSQLIESGAIILDDKKLQVTKGSGAIELIGLGEKSANRVTIMRDNKNKNLLEPLNSLIDSNDQFKVLLVHRPELFEVYVQEKIDFVFAGHTHGGQFRIPFVGGVYAPDQGPFPKLTEGIHTKEDTTMVVSRGLGNSVIPLRIFNRPELIVVTLSCDE